jgi:tetratricopeptide (TPR) repeat protein
LVQSAQLISNSNLRASAHDTGPVASPEQEVEILFNLALQQHSQKIYDQAQKNFTAVLNAAAAPSMKRSALLELAVMAQEQNQLARAEQILAHYAAKYPEDPSVPEVLLRQGLLYRQMGAPALALSKFYGVMTSVLTLKTGEMEYYHRLVLHAQTEIAETHYRQGKYQEAAPFFSRLLKLAAVELNKPAIQLKLVRCLAALTRLPEAVAQAEDFLSRYSAAPEEPEVRFVLATALRRLGQKQPALEQVFTLLRSPKGVLSHEGQESGFKSPESSRTREWMYWQQRAGNEIGNRLYEESDYVNALEVYTVLASLNSSPGWKVPAWYQIGLVYERLGQPQKALEVYGRIIREKELASDASPGLKTVVDMAKWRSDFLNWVDRAPVRASTRAKSEPSPVGPSAQSNPIPIRAQ